MTETDRQSLVQSQESRLARTEAITAQNTEAISQLTQSIGKLTNDVVGGFEKVRADIAGGRRVNWVPVGTFLGVFVAIGGLLYSFHGNEIARIEKRSDKADVAIIEAAYSRGRADETRDGNRLDIAGLRDSVNRLSDFQNHASAIHADHGARIGILEKRP